MAHIAGKMDRRRTGEEIMNDQTNAFTRAAKALGQVESMVKSGDDILSSVATAQQTMTSATGSLESTMTELGLIKDALSSATVAVREANDAVKEAHRETLASVEAQVDRALNHLRDLENSIRAVHEQTRESVETNSLKLDRQLDDTRRDIVRAINTSKQEVLSQTKGLLFLAGAVGVGVLVIIYGLYSYGILFS